MNGLNEFAWGNIYRELRDESDDVNNWVTYVQTTLVWLFMWIIFIPVSYVTYTLDMIVNTIVIMIVKLVKN